MKQLIILNRDLSVKKILTIDDVIPVRDIVSPKKTTFEIVKDESINISDFVIIKSRKITEYLGVIEDVTNDITTKIATYPLIHIADNNFILESLNGSIFNWVKKTFTDNFINSTDELTHIPFEFIDNSFQSVLTLPLENGNLFDVLLDIFLKTGVYLDFSLKYAGRKITNIICNVKKADDANKISLRYDNPLITKKPTIEFSQAQNVNKIIFVPSKANVNQLQTAEFYLLDNNTVTQDANDKRRIKGVVQKILEYSDTDTYIDLVNTANSELLGDAYSHQITIIIAHNDKFKFNLYDRVQYIDKNRIYNTYCTRIENYNNNKYYKVVLGVLRNSLTDKIKALQKTTSSASVSSSGGGSSVTVVDSLTSESPTEALSANQGRILKSYTDKAITQVIVNDETGVFTFTRQDGTSFSVDTLLEKVVVNFTYNEETQDLELTLEDGTIKKIPMTAFIDDYTGVDGETIKIDVSNDNKISATIKNGSITLDKLNEDLAKGYVTTKDLQYQEIDGVKYFKKSIRASSFVSGDTGTSFLNSGNYNVLLGSSDIDNVTLYSKSRPKVIDLSINGDVINQQVAYLSDLEHRVSLSGNTGSETRYYPLTQLPRKDYENNDASLLISGRIGGILETNTMLINCLIRNRECVSIVGSSYSVNSPTINNLYDICDIIVYEETNGVANIYIRCKGEFAFDIDAFRFYGEVPKYKLLYNGNYVTNPDGTYVDRFGHSIARIEIGQSGVDFCNGTAHYRLAKGADIPTKTSQLTNDSGYLTSDDVSGKMDLTDYVSKVKDNVVKSVTKFIREGGTDYIKIGKDGQSGDPVIMFGYTNNNVDYDVIKLGNHFLGSQIIGYPNLLCIDGVNTIYVKGTDNKINAVAYKKDIPTNYVTTNTTQTITGSKTFTQPVTVKSSSINLAPDSGNCGLEIGSTKTTSLSFIDFHTTAGKDYDVRLLASGNQLQITANSGVTINGKEIYTVVAHTYPEGWNNWNAYIRFGNGDLICYGWIQGNNTNWSQGTATFAQPFASTYSFTATPVLVNSGNAFIGTGEYNRQAGSCSVASYGNSTNDKISGWYYIAIGQFGG